MQKNFGYNMCLLCLMTGYKNFFDLNELKIKMGLALFQKVTAGVIETLFDEQNQPLFKRVDLGK